MTSKNDYYPIDPTGTLPTKFQPFQRPDFNIIIRLMSVPKDPPRLAENEYVLYYTFRLLLLSCSDLREEHKCATALALTCKRWNVLIKLYLAAPELLGLSFQDLRRLDEIEFHERIFSFSENIKKKFSAFAWELYGRSFFNILLETPGTLLLSSISFDGSFKSFLPSEWSTSLSRCTNIRSFAFQSEECVWDDIKEFLISFQTLSQVLLNDLWLTGISARRRDGAQIVDASQAIQVINVKDLEITTVCFTDISSNILPLIGPSLERVEFHKTSFSISCARKLIEFLSSPNSRSLTSIGCWSIPTHQDNYLLNEDESQDLDWPRAQKVQGIFFSSYLTRFRYDGGSFANKVITPHDISLFARMNLRFLILEYCFSDNVHPSLFASSLNLKYQWFSLEVLRITYLFNDPSWGIGSVESLVQDLRSAMDMYLEYEPEFVGYSREDCLFSGRFTERGQRSGSFHLTIREGGATDDQD
jgi:hypothetical protein